jgi:hypothetical protein
MKKLFLFIITFFTFFNYGISQTSHHLKIGFGSCISQDNEQKVWYKVEALHPDYFVFLGDNLYVSTNGYISFDAGNSGLITTESLRSVGILPADLVQNSLK